MKYEIIKSFRDEHYHITKVIEESEIYDTEEEAEIDRIYFQPKYDELLEVRELDINK